MSESTATEKPSYIREASDIREIDPTIVSMEQEKPTALTPEAWATIQERLGKTRPLTPAMKEAIARYRRLAGRSTKK